MKYDITLAVHEPGQHGSRRDVIVVEAVTGDEAAAAGQLAGEAKLGGGWFHIVNITPSAARVDDAPEAAVEGADFDEPDLVPASTSQTEDADR